MANYNRNFIPDQRFYLGVTGGTMEELRGVQAVDAGWTRPETPLVVLGRGFAGAAVEGEIEGSVSVTRLIVTASDSVTGLLGSGVQGVLAYGPNQQFDKSIVFDSGFVTSYSSACSIGDVPSADLSIAVFGDIGEGATGSLSFATNSDTAQIPVPGNISVDVSGFSTNAVQSYSVDVSISQRPLEKIGNNFAPTGFVLELPIQVSADFEMIVADYEAPDIRNTLCSPPSQTLTISLNDCAGAKIRAFTIPSGRFMGFSQSASVGGNMTISTQYISYFNSLGGVQSIFS